MKLKTISAALFSLVVLAGCSKLTQENYQLLETGMEYDEVVSLIGSPDNCSETLGVKSCIWGSESKNIKVKFLADKATIFSNSGLN